jgi:hypothetical protein
MNEELTAAAAPAIDDLLWAGGPSKAAMDKIKEDLKTKGYPAELYVVPAGTVSVICRIIPRVEYNDMGKKQFQDAVTKKLTPQQADELFNIALINAATVWKPEGFNFEDENLTACGVVPTLIEKIMELNGFDATPPRRI